MVKGDRGRFSVSFFRKWRQGTVPCLFFNSRDRAGSNVIKSVIPDARQELSIVPSDQWLEAEKMLRRLSAGAFANSHTLRQCSGTCSYARIFCASGQGSAASMDNSCRAVRWKKLNLVTLGQFPVFFFNRRQSRRQRTVPCLFFVNRKLQKKGFFHVFS